MNLERYDSPLAVAQAAANRIAEWAVQAVAERGQFVLALSGGRTPWPMLDQLAERDLPWRRIYLVQVDERTAAEGSNDRNLTHIRARLADRVPLPPDNLYPMPVSAQDLQRAAATYASLLKDLCGEPPVLDCVHLGLGSDGHTASLLPGDSLLDLEDADVGVSAVYQGHRRMSLTRPVINGARHILWLVLGADKHAMLQRLLEGDERIPAGRISRHQALVLTDIPAASA